MRFWEVESLLVLDFLEGRSETLLSDLRLLPPLTERPEREANDV
jgi:hypothetical protein